MSLIDTRFAVQTSVLSKRWKLVWTTLPSLIFNGYEQHYHDKKLVYSKFFNNFFSKRNPRSPILKLDINPRDGLDLRLIKKYVKYAISHNVQLLSVKSYRYCSLSTFSSNSLKQLKLRMKFEDGNVMESDRWTLPNLTTLYLTDYNYYVKRKFPESCLICLPALTTLGLDSCELPEFFGLPSLTTLCLENCTLPKSVWDFPALLTLQLLNVGFPKNVSEYFRSLASLRNLAIDFGREDIGCCVISSSQLVNLKIKAPLGTANACASKIEVLAPTLCNFSAVGFFRITFEDSVLENVSIKYWDCTNLTKKEKLWLLEHHRDLFKIMFSQLGSARILALDMVTVKALSEISDILVHLRSPFPNLKYLKLPHGCEESDISSSVRQYLLGGSPHATIVKTVFRDEVNTKMAPHFDKVGQIRTPVAGESNGWNSSSRDDNYLVSWQGNEVNSEFGGLLDLIMKRYPETFEQLPTKNKKIWTLKLNMLCSSVNAFTKTSKTEIDNEMLTEYRAIFTDLQRWGFNLNWLMSHLNHIEQVLLSKPLLYEPRAIDSRVDDAKSTLCAEKMADLESSRTMGTNLTVTGGCIGDDIL